MKTGEVPAAPALISGKLGIVFFHGTDRADRVWAT